MAKNDDVVIPGQLREALEAYAEQRYLMLQDVDVRKARQKVIDLTHMLQDAQTKLDNAERSYRDAQAELAPYIVGQVMELGSSVEHSGVKVNHRAGYVSRSWKGGELTALEESDPKLWKKIVGFRGEKDVAPSVKIED